MEISLRERTATHVIQYFNNTQDSTIQNMLPKTVHTVEDALENFDRSTRPDSTSYGRTIYVDEMYVGDVWCCRIGKHNMPQAMLSYCIFEKQYWGKGIATSAVKLFLSDLRLKYGVTVVGAYTYSTNIASIRVLEHCGFKLEDDFLEDGILSYYFLLDC